MRDLLKLWTLELRRGRWMLASALAAIALTALFCFGGILSYQTRNALGFIASFALLFIGGFVSSDVVARDFKDKTINFYLALPIPDWKLYLAKYLASFFVFAVFAALPLTLLVAFNHRTFADTLLEVAAWIAALLLLLHAMTFVWTIMLRGDKALLFAMVLTPLALLLLWPGMIWIYDIGAINDINRNSLTAGWLAWTLFFLIGGRLLWRTGVVRGRPLLKPGLLFFLALVGTSLASWALFHTIDITEYLATLRKFEHTPGIEIVRGPIDVSEAIMTFDEKKSGGSDALLTLDFDRKVTIPAEAYPAYYRKQNDLFEAIAKAIRNEAKLDNRTKLVALLRLQEKYPAETIPLLSSYIRRGRRGEKSPMLMEIWTLSGTANLRTVPPSPELLNFYRALPRCTGQPIRVVADPDEQVAFSSDGTSWFGKNPERRWYCESLRNCLPGAATHGWSRFAAVLDWVLRHDFTFPPFAGFKLQKATDTMKLWMAALAAEHELNCAVPPEKIPDHIRNFLLTHPQELTTQRIRRIITTCQCLPYLRLREWQIRHGKLPDEPAVVLAPEEKGRLELRYCTGLGKKHQPIAKPGNEKLFLHISFTGLPDRQHLCLELPAENNQRGKANHE